MGQHGTGDRTEKRRLAFSSYQLLGGQYSVKLGKVGCFIYLSLASLSWQEIFW